MPGELSDGVDGSRGRLSGLFPTRPFPVRVGRFPLHLRAHVHTECVFFASTRLAANDFVLVEHVLTMRFYVHSFSPTGTSKRRMLAKSTFGRLIFIHRLALIEVDLRPHDRSRGARIPT